MPTVAGREQQTHRPTKNRAKARLSVPQGTGRTHPLVPKERIELSRGVASADFESAASTVPPLRRGAGDYSDRHHFYQWPRDESKKRGPLARARSGENCEAVENPDRDGSIEPIRLRTRASRHTSSKLVEPRQKAGLGGSPCADSGATCVDESILSPRAGAAVTAAPWFASICMGRAGQRKGGPQAAFA